MKRLMAETGATGAQQVRPVSALLQQSRLVLDAMRAFLIAALLVALAGCELDEPTLGGTIVSVVEAEQPGREPSPRQYEDLLWPEVAWKIDVRLDTGEEVTVIHNGERRYAPGERVHLLPAEDGELLL
jgi:hypothetical protein